MKIVFFGTGEFAIPALKALIGSRHAVLAAVTQPDREKGRSLKVSPPPVKVVALTHTISVYQPDDASSISSVAYLEALQPDLFVVVSFGQILKKEVLEIPKLYAVNIHGSLLPKYRGAAPTNWTIINGETTSGVSIIRMNEKMDEGDIILQKEVAIGEEDTNITLHETLSDLGAHAIADTIELIEKGTVTFRKQGGGNATYAPKLKKADGLIRWDEPAAVIRNKVRGLLPWPGAYTHWNGKVVKILHARVGDASVESGAACGEVIRIDNGKGIVVATASGTLIVEYLQLEGKKPLDADAFLRGHRIIPGSQFT